MVVLVFSKKQAIVSRLICFWTWGDWSHVDFELPTGFTLLDGTVLSKPQLLGARLFGGVQVREYDPNRTYERWETVLPDEVLEEARYHIGAKFRLIAVIGHLFRIDLSDHTKVDYCAEFISWICELAGTLVCRSTEHFKITPWDIYISHKLIRKL